MQRPAPKIDDSEFWSRQRWFVEASGGLVRLQAQQLAGHMCMADLCW